MIKYNDILLKTAETLVKASTTFSADKIEAYERAADIENNPNAKWVLENILENSQVAKQTRFPLCDDTGIPHVFLEIGDRAVLPEGFISAIKEGIRTGLSQLPGRPMAVKGDDRERISQSCGLSDDSGDLEMAPIQIRELKDSNKVALTVLMLGGGPEIRGKTLRVFHKHSDQVVIDEMIEWAKEGCDKLGCLPAVLSFGIGRTNLEAASLSLEAMRHGNFLIQSDIEKEITDKVNEAGYGPLGLGGKTTVLGTFVKVGPQRASGVRIVSMRVGCCFDPRKWTVIL